MRLWRISSFANLTGEGGLIVPGRWHSRGRKVVYVGDHAASTMLEMLVHFDISAKDVPDTYQLLAIDVPDDINFGAIGVDELPPNWLNNSADTREIGDRWLAENRRALLRVPSAIVPAAFNWLLNPTHPDAARIKISEIIQAPFDPRLLRRPTPAETPSRRGRVQPGRGRNPRPSGARGRRRKRKPSPA